MRVGDLVIVGPHASKPCVVVGMEARNEAGVLPDCVLLWVPDCTGKVPMNKKWITVINAVE